MECDISDGPRNAVGSKLISFREMVKYFIWLPPGKDWQEIYYFENQWTSDLESEENKVPRGNT